MLPLKSDFSKSSCSSRCTALEFVTCRVAFRAKPRAKESEMIAAEVGWLLPELTFP